MSWLEEYADALARRSRSDLGLSAEEMRLMLDLAREVAHRTERRFAPVSTFLAGKFAAKRIRSGSTADDAVREALEVARELLPPEPPAAP